MSVLRNAMFSLAAVALLIGGLLILVPSPVGATVVLLQSSNVGDLTITTDNVGTSSDVYSFTVATTVDIPGGEHVPLNFARVLVANSGAGFSGGLLQAVFCTADSNAVSNPRSQILSVTGANSASAPYAAVGYTPTASGYGYDFSSPSAVNFGGASGGGYGYGYAQGVKVTVTIRVTGCIGPVGSAAPFAFTASTPQVAFRVQVLLGGSAAQTFKSAPANVVFFDPNYVAPSAPNTGSETLQPGPTSRSGGQEGYSFTVTDSDGDATAFEPAAAGTTFPCTTFPAGAGPTDGVCFVLITQQQLPAGSQVLFTFQDQGTTQSSTAPPFNINPTLLSGQLNGGTPALYVNIQLSIPGMGVVPATSYVDVNVVIKVPAAYFTGPPVRSPDNFVLKAFKADGTLESPQPTLTAGPTLVSGNYQYTFHITAFSSFVGFSLISGGGIGGGGGGGGGTPVVTSTATSTGTETATGTTTGITTGTTPGTSTGTSTGTGTQTGTQTGSSTGASSGASTSKGKGAIPGFELVAGLAGLGAVLVLARRRLA